MDPNNELYDADEETLNRIGAQKAAINQGEILQQARDQTGQVPGGAQEPPAIIPPLPPVGGTLAPEAHPTDEVANFVDTNINAQLNSSAPVGDVAIIFNDPSLAIGDVEQPDTSVPLGDAAIGFNEVCEISDTTEPVASEPLADAATRSIQPLETSSIPQPDTSVPMTEQPDLGARATSLDEPTDPLDDWPDEQMDIEEDSSRFERVKAWYDRLKEPSLPDQVAYEAAKMREDARKKRVANRKLLEQQQDLDPDDTNDNELFCRPNEPGAPSEPGNTSNGQIPQDQPGPSNQAPKPIKPTQSKRKKQNRISAEEKRQSMRFGLESARSKAGKKAGKGGRKRKAGAPDTTVEAEAEGSGQKGKKKRGPKRGKEQTLRNGFDNLFVSDVVASAQTNSSLPGIPVMTEKDKEKALAQLVASIPTSDQAEARSDRQMILDASRKFTRTARMDGQGGWIIKGLRTSLHHYQLIGAGFMRDRENSSHPPYGGMLCDEMGFGKTLQALANIVDGKPAESSDPLKTTLIVVPPSLVLQWKNQIILHCNRAVIGRVLEYHAGSRLSTLDEEQTVQAIQDYDVVITTYEEVRKSYPVYNPPGGITDDAEIEQGWIDTYDRYRGPLHRIKFRRILLDEAHIIKNHLSKTSMAIRGLTAQFKWVLTGTPLHNRLAEFYSYFDFLGVRHTGSYEQFLSNYFRDDNARECLKNIVRSVLLRRTHDSRLFSQPVIKLPDIEARTIETVFCEVEQTLYNRIFTIFTENIKGIPETDKLARYRCFLTMILKLRMFASHPLAVQDMLKSMLTDVMVRQLKSLSNEAKDPEHPSSKITKWLLTLRKQITMPAKPSQPTQGSSKTTENQTAEPTQSVQPAHYLQGDTDKLVRQFHEFMTQLHNEAKWAERLARTDCPLCRMLPLESIITSCKHMYCEECYGSLADNDQSSNRKPVCVQCKVEIEEAARCGPIDDYQFNMPGPTAPSAPQQTPKTRNRQMKKPSRGGHGMFSNRQYTTDGNATGADNPDDDDKTDWVASAAGDMPGAKLTKVRETVASWIAQDEEVKIVVFTQFLDFVDVFAATCEREHWGYVCLTGKMPRSLRQKSMTDFRNESKVNVLIASLKAGGIGLDMSMANKCILVDFWWNEAIQEQAICRLYRIGQEQKVEFVKIAVKLTIDDYLLKIQKRKTAEINEAISEEALKQRETVEDLLRMFDALPDGQSGGFILLPGREEHRTQRKAPVELG